MNRWTVRCEWRRLVRVAAPEVACRLPSDAVLTRVRFDGEHVAMTFVAGESNGQVVDWPDSDDDVLAPPTSSEANVLAPPTSSEANVLAPPTSSGANPLLDTGETG